MSYLQRLKDINAKYGMFHAMTDETDAGDSEFLFSAKDNLTSLDMETCAGSRILQGYVPAFDAAAIERMKAAGGMLVGKTNMDEFGFGTFSANSAYEIPRNPFDRERSCGGSSGGSACAAAVLEDHVSLGVSTGGSICCPASFCGVYGIAPTYGRVSRYGLIDYGNSLDKIGVLSAKASDLRKYITIMAGRDERDPTSCVQPELKSERRRMKSVAVPKDGIQGLSGDHGHNDLQYDHSCEQKGSPDALGLYPLAKSLRLLGKVDQGPSGKPTDQRREQKKEGQPAAGDPFFLFVCEVPLAVHGRWSFLRIMSLCGDCCHISADYIINGSERIVQGKGLK